MANETQRHTHTYTCPQNSKHLYIRLCRYIYIYIYIKYPPQYPGVVASCIKTIDIYSVFVLNSCIFCKANSWTKKNKTRKKTTTKPKKKHNPSPHHGWDSLVFCFCFLVQGNVAQQIPNVAQHLRSMRGYVNLCETRHDM